MYFRKLIFKRNKINPIFSTTIHIKNNLLSIIIHTIKSANFICKFSQSSNEKILLYSFFLILLQKNHKAITNINSNRCIFCTGFNLVIRMSKLIPSWASPCAFHVSYLQVWKQYHLIMPFQPSLQLSRLQGQS